MKRCLLTLLFMLFMLPALFVKAAADSPETVPNDPDSYLIHSDDEYGFYLDDASTCHVFQIELFKTSRIRFTGTGDSVTRYNIAIYGSDKKRIQEQGIHGDNKTVYFFLEPGQYYAAFLPAGEFGSCSFYYLEVPTYDSFEETKSKNDNTYQKANYANLNKMIYGTIAADESKTEIHGLEDVSARCDCYKFTIPYTNPAVRLDFYSSMYRVNIIVKSKTDPTGDVLKNYTSTSVNGYGYTTHSDFGPMILTPGEYYLYIFSDYYLGQYNFRLEYDLEANKNLGTVYTTVGQQASVSGLPTGPATFEYGDQGLCKITSAKLQGLKAGSTNVIGYFNNSNKDVVAFKAVVEFKDVIHGSDHGKNPYYYDAVYWAADRGITAGVKNNSTNLYENFDPQGKCTRAQMIAFMWRMAGAPHSYFPVKFEDVKETDYYYTAVAWGLENGIIGGYPDGTFKPQNVCTRAQAVSFLYRMNDCPEVTPDASSSFGDMNYSDGSYYNKAVIWAAQNGITGGYSDGNFKPQNACTRAQMVSFLKRCEDTFSKG